MKKTSRFTNLTKKDIRRLNRKSLVNVSGVGFDPSQADIEMAEAHLASLFNCRIYRPFAVKMLYLNELY